MKSTDGPDSDEPTIAYSPLMDLFPHVLTQCLGALEAVIPFFNAIDLSAKDGEAYDEWETLVQQFFNSFVVMAITDGDTPAPARFKKLGFAWEKGSAGTVVSARMGNKLYFLDNLMSEDGVQMTMEWVPLENGIPNYKEAFRVQELVAFHEFRTINVAT